MRRAVLVLHLCLGAAGSAAGQLAPPGTGGVAALADALQQLGANKRVLVIGAHPDDENTQLLALVARAMGGRAAYLSLTRGEGGQNLIGPELGTSLGIIRTGELLAARAVDGAEQYFTRAYDFGFSKSADETFGIWSRDSLLQDVLDVIRRFRPQVVLSVFGGTSRDGHGQHQAAGILAHEAYRILRDSAWGPVKLYRGAFRDSATSTLALSTGVLDPLIGRSYAQIAAESRSRHRSQDFGALQRPGPATVRLALVDSRAPGPDTALFAGVDTTLAGPDPSRFVALIDSARARLNPWRPAAVLPYLLRARAFLPPRDTERAATLDRAVAIAAGLTLDAVTDDDVVMAGQRVVVEVTVWNAGPAPAHVDSIALVAPAEWTIEALDPAATTLPPDSVLVRRFAVTLPPDAPRDQPYFVWRPPAGGLYDWTGVSPELRGLAFDPPPLVARAYVRLSGGVCPPGSGELGAVPSVRDTGSGSRSQAVSRSRSEPLPALCSVTLEREAVYRVRDQAVGEVRRPLLVTRPFEIELAPAMLVWPVDGAAARVRREGPSRRLTLTVTNRSRGPATARLRLVVPDGWRVSAPDSVTFAREDERRAIAVTLHAPPGVRPGDFAVGAVALDEDGRATEGALAVIDYPHIRQRAFGTRSRATIRVARLALPALRRVGYVRGASDRVPEELLAIGVPLELLGPDSLARGDLSSYDAIVVGSRAYETEPALVAGNGRLLEYARGGGLVIVQYQQYQFVEGGFAPYPLAIGRPHDRVTDETVPVTALEPAHPLFRSPNTIGPEDWSGWVQERGLYFAREWDAAYAPLLEMGDPGGPPLRGGLLVAPVGRGTYVYTGISFFRQLPAGVPGAFRLFLNLLNLRARGVP